MRRGWRFAPWTTDTHLRSNAKQQKPFSTRSRLSVALGRHAIDRKTHELGANKTSLPVDFYLTYALNTYMDALSTTFAALADPTRRAILERLAQGDTHVGALAEPFDISAPAVSRHLRVLEAAGLISREVDAQWRLCRLRTPPLQLAHGWLQHYAEHWEHGLDRLTELVEARHARTPRRPSRRSKTR